MATDAGSQVNRQQLRYAWAGSPGEPASGKGPTGRRRAASPSLEMVVAPGSGLMEPGGPTGGKVPPGPLRSLGVCVRN